MSVIDILFPVQGGPVPLDHGYVLFSALSARLPVLHARPDIGVFTLRGESATRELLHLGRGTLRLRCPAETIPMLLPLVGAPLEVAGRKLVLGAPTLRPLEPVSSLSARIVTFKHSLDEATFQAAALRFLADLGCQARLKVGRRRVVGIAGKRVVGFALDLEGLSSEHSVLLQEKGLGGRRHMGCGLFLPTRAERFASSLKARGLAAA
jgi:CRISPR-associated protein Cas6